MPFFNPMMMPQMAPAADGSKVVAFPGLPQLNQMPMMPMMPPQMGFAQGSQNSMFMMTPGQLQPQAQAA